MDLYEARKCTTLGTAWRDIYRNGTLFAREVDVDMAERWCANPSLFLGNVGADVPRLRRMVMEMEEARSRAYEEAKARVAGGTGEEPNP